jgi:hypothetical protein
MVTAVRARGILGMALTWAVGLAGLSTALLVGGVVLGIVPSSVYGIRELAAGDLTRTPADVAFGDIKALRIRARCGSIIVSCSMRATHQSPGR